MRKLIVLLYVSMIFSTAVYAEEVEMEMDLMQNIEDVNKSLASNIALQRVDPSLEDANQLTSMFEVVEAHFIKKGDAENAVDLSKKSKQLSQDIAKLVTEKNFDTATNLATDLSRACKSCHTFYKKE